MPEIRVEFKDQKRKILSDGVNTPLVLVTTRLEMQVRVIGFPTPLECWIDTGSPLTLVSKKVWNHETVLPRIEWILFPPGATTLRLPELTLAGRSYVYRLGRLSMEAFDSTGATLPAVPVTAQFLEDEDQPNRPALKPALLVGLLNGIIEGRYLVIKPDSLKREAWLTDVRPAPSPASPTSPLPSREPVANPTPP